MSEANEMRRIMLDLSAAGATVFRNNVGTGWTGKVEHISARKVVTVEPGDVLIRAARPLRAGLCEGSADIIGWTPKLVTPAMVGAHVAIFTAIEVKAKGGRVTDKQRNFLVQAKAAGAYAGVAYDNGDARTLIGMAA